MVERWYNNFIQLPAIGKSIMPALTYIGKAFREKSTAPWLVENPPITSQMKTWRIMGLLLIRFSRIQPIRWPFDNAGTVNGKGFPWEKVGPYGRKQSATSLWNESDIKISELTTSRMQRLFTFKVANPHWPTFPSPLSAPVARPRHGRAPGDQWQVPNAQPIFPTAGLARIQWLQTLKRVIPHRQAMLEIHTCEPFSGHLVTGGKSSGSSSSSSSRWHP